MDADAFQHEALKYERLMYRISYAMLRQNDDCADAIQETLLRAWQHRSELNKRSAFRSWICRILVNVCNDMLRRRARVSYTELTDAIPAAKPDYDKLALEEALDKLPPPQRTTIVLHYLEGWPVRRIAEAFSVPQSTVKTRLMYARQRLESLLSDEAEVRK